MISNSNHVRPLDDIDVRDEESDAKCVAGGRIELATFVEGEYVESILISRARAAQIYRNLGKLLGETSRTFEALRRAEALIASDIVRDHAGCLAEIRTALKEARIMSDTTRTMRPSELKANGDPQDPASYAYRVAWFIDIEAASPQEAAAEARRIQLNPDSIATVFDVQAGDGTTVCIDIEPSEESY